MAVKVADTLKPMGNFPIAEAMDVAFGDGESLQKKLDDGTLGGGGDKIQYDIMPNATAELSGKIIQFTGDTGTYVSGAFYKCVEKEGSFSWEKVSSDSYDDTEIREEIEKKAEIDDSDKESTTTTLSAKAISDSLVDKVGDLSELKTTEKSNLVGAINEVKQSGGGGNLKVGTFSGTPNSSGNLATSLSQDDIFILSGASKNACVSPFTYDGRWTFHCTGFGKAYTPVTTNLSVEYVYYEL